MKTCYLNIETRVIADLSAPGEVLVDAWCVHRINVPAARRGEGLGSLVLTSICRDADREGVKLGLIPMASGAGGLTQAQLVDWYMRYGFRFRTDDAGYMMRDPK